MRSDLHNIYFKTAIQQLYSEFQRCNLQRRLHLNPCLITIEETDQYWGQWNQKLRKISIALRLIESHEWHDVVGVLRHEMAHQYVDEVLRLKEPMDRPHGILFQQACLKVGVPYFYATASVNLAQNTLDWRQTAPSSEQERLLEKVRKLLNLASSNNEHEALLAMNRVREIYARYNLEKLKAASPTEFYHSILQTGRKRLHTYEQKIMSILVNHYNVEVIVGSSYNAEKMTTQRTIEMIGRRENVLMAEYVFDFLKTLTTDLVLKKKKSQKGISQGVLNTFHLGLLTGFDERLSEHTESQPTQEIKNSLALFRQDPLLKKYISSIHPHLVRVSSQARLRDKNLFEQGKVAGRSITIHKPIETTATNSQKFLK